MMIELTKEEVAILNTLVAHHLGWATYKTQHITMPGEEKDLMLKDIDTLNLLAEKIEKSAIDEL